MGVRTFVFAAIAGWALSARPAHAAIEEDTALFSLDLGLAIPKTSVDTGFGRTAAGTFGPALGATYLYHFTPSFGFGGRISYLRYGKSAKSLAENSGALGVNAASSQVLVQALGRYVFRSEEAEYPYVLAGVGANRFRSTITGTPGPGFAWPDTGSFERRTLVRRDLIGFVISFGMGLEFSMGKRSQGSVELIWNDAKVEPSDKHNGVSITLGVRLGWELD